MKVKFCLFTFIPLLAIIAPESHFLPQSVRTSDNVPLTFTLETKIPLNGGAYITDNLQNVYVWNHCSLKKYDPKGHLLYIYDDRSYGDISSLDVTDPMKIMVFYKDFPEIVFIDNTLSVNGTHINPSRLGFPLTSLACLSHDNGVWLYDAQNLQLVRLDMNMNIKQETGSLMELLGYPVNPDYLLEYNDYIYMNDPSLGILEFDEFGTYYRTIPVKGLTNFELRGDELYYTKANQLHTFHLNTLADDGISLPDSVVHLARVEKNLLFEDSRDTVNVYLIK